jgi:hypothetical protein
MYLHFPPSLSEDDIPETSNVKFTGRFEGTGVDVVAVVETVSFWDSRFFVVAGSLFLFFLFNANGLKANSYLFKAKQTKFIFEVIYL